MNFRKIWLKGEALYLFALDFQEPHAPQPSSSAQNRFLKQGRLSQSPVTSPAGGFLLSKRQLLPQPAPCREGWSQRWQSWGCIAPIPRLALLCCWAKFLLPRCNVRFALLISVSAHWDHTPPPWPQGSTLLAQQKTLAKFALASGETGCAHAVAVGLFMAHVAVRGGRDCAVCHAITSKIALPQGTDLVPGAFLAQRELLLCSCTPRCCGTMPWEQGCSSGPGLRARLDLSPASSRVVS